MEVEPPPLPPVISLLLSDRTHMAVPDGCLPRYPTRKAHRTVYQEEQLSDEDEYLCELTRSPVI